MAECMTPFTIRTKLTNQSQAVPCGKCPACQKRRASAWSFRLLQEDKISLKSTFTTLTYDTDHVPITSNGFMSLNFNDLQLFFKRLRKAHEKFGEGYPQIKYYAVGEYGGKFKRPHYHVIFFNADPNLIDQAWQNGSVMNGTVTGASVGYTLKYMCKKPQVPRHKNDDRVPEDSRMSKGLGESYLTPQMCAWHKRDLHNRMYCELPGNQKISMPRYYKDKIYHPEQRKAVGATTRQNMLKKLDQSEAENPDYHYQRFLAHKHQFYVHGEADRVDSTLSIF